MGSANRIPICLSGYYASDRRRVVPVPGLTGFAITSLRSYNLMEPIDRLELVSALGSRHKIGNMAGLVGLAPSHDRPNDTGHLVGHGHTGYTRRFPGK